MTDWQPTFLAAAVVILGGTVVGVLAGVLAGGPSGDGATTVTQVVTRASTAVQSQTGSPSTTIDPAGIAVTPPADLDAPDTLNELNDSDKVESTGSPRFGIVTIAKKTYEGVAIATNRESVALGFLPNQLVITTKGRYKRINGLVGINDDAECTENAANAWITNGNGERLWGPERVRFNSPKRFDFSIKNRAVITFEQLTVAPADNPCAGDAYLAWGDVKFVK